jgi:hypothetical protein
MFVLTQLARWSREKGNASIAANGAANDIRTRLHTIASSTDGQAFLTRLANELEPKACLRQFFLFVFFFFLVGGEGCLFVRFPCLVEFSLACTNPSLITQSIRCGPRTLNQKTLPPLHPVVSF